MAIDHHTPERTAYLPYIFLSPTSSPFILVFLFYHSHLLRFCGLIQFQGEVRKKVLFQLLLLLCYPYPVVRPSDTRLSFRALVRPVG